MKFRIRVNIDQFNQKFIFNLIEDLIQRKVWPHKHARFYIASVESSSESDLNKKDFAILEDNVRHYMMEKYNEISVSNDAKLEFKYPVFGGEVKCGYGILKNMWVINYNGEIFRCWESVGQKEHVIGTIKDLLKDFGLSIYEKTKIDHQTIEKWGCYECKCFPICGVNCPWDFLNEKTKRRCTVWKNILEYRILSQYKLYLKEPNIFKKVPFCIG